MVAGCVGSACPAIGCLVSGCGRLLPGAWVQTDWLGWFVLSVALALAAGKNSGWWLLVALVPTARLFVAQLLVADGSTWALAGGVAWVPAAGGFTWVLTACCACLQTARVKQN